MTPLELVPGSPFARRDDVELQRGLFTLVDPQLVPRDAMLADLVAVHDALDAGGVAHLLVRGDRDRPVIAVDRRERKRLTAVLAAAFADEPFYARTMDRGDRPHALLADGVLSRHGKSRVLRVFRPRAVPVGELRYGAANAPQIELWDFGPEYVEAPLENAIMRRRMPRVDLTEQTIDRYGATWQTLAGMFDEHASDVAFPIDIVFSWVDGTDLEFQRARAKRMEAYVVGEGDDSEARFRQIDELKFALRSVYLFAPWIRNIYIATDSPRPAWLAEHPRVTFVPSEAMFADTSVLPTHNSHAVEAQLHRIPGISEYFLYSNDDMFFGRYVAPDMFFSPGGITKFIEADLRIGLGDNHPQRSGYENAARNNRRLLAQRFGKVTTRHLEHAPTPLRASVMAELEQTFPDEIAATAASRFRSASDVSVTNSLYHYFALMTGRAVVQQKFRFQYIETTLQRALPAMRRLLRTRSLDFFCLNDGSFPEISVEERTTAVRQFLEQYYPVPAPWEVPAADEVSAARAAASSSAAQEPPAS